MKAGTTIVLLTLLVVGSAPGNQLHLGKSLDQWTGQLDSSDRLERLLAVRSLGEMAIAGAPGADKALLGAFQHRDSAVRYWAVVAVGQMGERGRTAKDSLHQLLGDPAPEVRCWAAYAAAGLGDADKALAVLIREMANLEKGARLQAAHVLDALGEKAKPAANALAKGLDDDFDYVRRVSRHALWVLGERPCPYEECSTK